MNPKQVVQKRDTKIKSYPASTLAKEVISKAHIGTQQIGLDTWKNVFFIINYFTP